MSVEAAGLLALAIFLGLVVPAWLQSRRPKYLITVQKTTNSASQPEIVTVQANLPARADEEAIWHETERMALAATSRMVTVNEMILDHTREVSEKIAAERPELKHKFLRKLDKRRRRFAASKLGIPIDQVTDEHIKALVQNGGAPAEEP